MIEAMEAVLLRSGQGSSSMQTMPHLYLTHQVLEGCRQTGFWQELPVALTFQGYLQQVDASQLIVCTCLRHWRGMASAMHPCMHHCWSAERG
jgi:hypothetical protein